MQDTAEGIQACLKKGQNTSLFGMETSGHNRRMEEILESRTKDDYLGIIDPRLIEKYNENMLKDYLYRSFLSLDKSSYLTRYDCFDSLLFASKKDFRIIILVKNTEIAMARFPEMFGFIRSITKILRGKCVIAFAGNHHALRLETTSVKNAHIFLGNVFINSPYDDSESKKIFYSYLIPKPWVNKSVVRYVLDICGGNPNIVQGVAKYFNSCRNKPQDLSTGYLVTKSEVAVRLNQILGSFNDEELGILKSVVLGRAVQPGGSSFHLLTDIGFVNSKSQIFSKLMLNYIQNKFDREKSGIDIMENEVQINGRPIYRFSENELALLRVLLKSRGRIVMKDDLFDDIWKGDYEKYSDWNLDQLVRRVRKKLHKYNLDDNLLTVKRRGLLWHDSI